MKIRRRHSNIFRKYKIDCFRFQFCVSCKTLIERHTQFTIRAMCLHYNKERGAILIKTLDRECVSSLQKGNGLRGYLTSGSNEIVVNQENESQRNRNDSNVNRRIKKCLSSV